MEWVETTGKSVEEAREHALDRLGVGEHEAEFEILDQPRPGLFGRVRGEARVRARIRPTAVRPKQDRRPRGRRTRNDGDGEQGEGLAPTPTAVADQAARPARQPAQAARTRQRRERATMDSETSSSSEERATGGGEASEAIDPEAVGTAAVEFMTGLATAFGSPAKATLTVSGTELDVHLEGGELGLLIGPGGRTLMAVQDLARVAAQRRLGDHDTRLRIDVAGYRERRRAALEKFALAVANEVRTTGRSKALEPMASADRKIVHDAIQALDGVASHSDGEEPRRRVVIVPA